jgi:alpha-D-ribose 1-methylphosphonate 5-triphosphate synthase subunit PhnH
MNAVTLPAGFADPVIEAQANFHSLMNALARPGSIQTLTALSQSPAPLDPGLAVIALTLADHEAPIWLDEVLAAAPGVREFLRFHTGARQVESPAEAQFAFVSDWSTLPDLAAFAQGSDEYPDRSTTVIVAVASLEAGSTLMLRGPGIAETTALAVAGWPNGLSAQLDRNHRLFPRGVDLVLVAPGAIAALPRTTRVLEG